MEKLYLILHIVGVANMDLGQLRVFLLMMGAFLSLLYIFMDGGWNEPWKEAEP